MKPPKVISCNSIPCGQVGDRMELLGMALEAQPDAYADSARLAMLADQLGIAERHAEVYWPHSFFCRIEPPPSTCHHARHIHRLLAQSVLPGARGNVGPWSSHLGAPPLDFVPCEGHPQQRQALRGLCPRGSAVKNCIGAAGAHAPGGRCPGRAGPRCRSRACRRACQGGLRARLGGGRAGAQHTPSPLHCAAL